MFTRKTNEKEDNFYNYFYKDKTNEKDQETHMLLTCTRDGGVSKDGKIPWLKEENFYMQILKFLNMKEENTCIIMGRKTHDAFKDKLECEHKCRVVVITKNPDSLESQFEKSDSVSKTLTTLKKDNNIKNILIVGGISILREAFYNTNVSGLIVLSTRHHFECDYFIDIKCVKDNFSLVKSFYEPDLNVVHNKISHNLLLMLRDEKIQANTFAKTAIYIVLTTLFILPFITSLFVKNE
jgi:dihydrofolate reductase